MTTTTDIYGFYLHDADLTNRKVTLCKSYSKGKPQHTIKAFASYNVFEYVYKFIGSQCAITLTNDSKQIKAIYECPKEFLEVPAEETL